MKQASCDKKNEKVFARLRTQIEESLKPEKANLSEHPDLATNQ